MRRMSLLAIGLLALVAAPMFADKTQIPGLNRYVLDNGLELFVLENHAVPLARIQITFRCGSITQSPDTAGLFHFYEHMLFKGNSKYGTETEFSAAMTELGVSEWNGGTSTEYVTYYFTVPSDKTGAGLEFWSYAIREPLFDAAELEVEKGVVINEINGRLSDPDVVFDAAVDRNLFGKYPWRRDIGGSPAIIQSATVQTMRDIQQAFYIPNNAAIFVGGDVDPEAVRAMVQSWFGSWKRGADPWKSPAPAHPTPGVARSTFLVYPDDSLPAGIAYAEVKYRGPDVVADPQATYAADVWGTLLGNPDGKFVNGVYDNVPDLYEKKYINGYYYTQRDGGQVIFSTYLYTADDKPAAQRAIQFKERVKGVEITAQRDDPAYFADAEFAIVKQKLEDDRIVSLETAEGFIESMSFWWAVSSTDYFLGYVENMLKMTPKELKAYLDRYVLKNLEVVAVRINPADYKAQAKDFADAGYTVVGPDTAFWWKASK